MNYSTCKCEADSFHGDEYLPDADEYPPMQQWEIDEALADILGDDRWLQRQQERAE